MILEAAFTIAMLGVLLYKVYSHVMLNICIYILYIVYCADEYYSIICESNEII